jgi:polysaccharide biosynthesis/export protein
LTQTRVGEWNEAAGSRLPLCRAAAGVALLAGLAAGLGGCMETDSFLLDPSVIGRWEQTPTTVPILSRLASVEGPEDEFLEVSEVSPADLLPEVTEYRVGAGDRLAVQLYDFPEVDRPTPPLDITVDPRGYLNLPQLPPVYVSGLTVQGTQQAIQEQMQAFIAEPRSFVQVLGPRQQQYYVLGGVQQPSAYFIPAADYRLLQALSAAGGFSESPQYIYVIRQLPLEDVASARPVPARPRPRDEEGMTPPPAGPSLIDTIRDLSRPAEPPARDRPLEDLPPTPPTNPPPAPGDRPPGSPAVFQPPSGQPTTPPPAPIDLVDPSRPVAQPEPPPSPDTADMTWIFLDGKWMKVRRSGPGAGPELPGAPTPGVTQLVTQRVIRIPVTPLKNGDARYNIVVRPGDIIRVPPPPAGTIYLTGQIVRPGAFNNAERLTLMRVIAAAGGLSAIAVPERTDVVRMVAGDRQAMVRVNLRAIQEGTQPDIYLKSDDLINVGSNFWAVPLAVIRNGFRMTYGFGFLIDRNFGNDVFGAPPAERFQ